jgi:hypothetical protein
MSTTKRFLYIIVVRSPPGSRLGAVNLNRCQPFISISNTDRTFKITCDHFRGSNTALSLRPEHRTIFLCRFVTYRTVEQPFSNRHDISNPFFNMSAFDLPFADAVRTQTSWYFIYGATALTTILLDYRHMYHDIVCIINEAEDFYEVSHDIIIIMAKFTFQ